MYRLPSGPHEQYPTPEQGTKTSPAGCLAGVRRQGVWRVCGKSRAGQGETRRETRGGRAEAGGRQGVWRVCGKSAAKPPKTAKNPKTSRETRGGKAAGGKPLIPVVTFLTPLAGWRTEAEKPVGARPQQKSQRQAAASHLSLW